MRIALFLLIVSCGGGAATQTTPQTLPQSTAQKTYEIHMHRDARVGEREHVILDAADDSTTITTRDGVELERKHERKTVHFDAMATVVAVDGKNDAIHVRYDVTSLVANDKPIFEGPVDLTRALDESQAVILANGAQPEPALRDALKAVLSLRVGGASDDAVFGTRELQAVGGRWPVDGKLAAADLANDPKFRASSVTGESTLAGVTDCCLDVRSAIQMTGLSVPNVPVGAIEGRVDGTFQALIPTDRARGRVEDHMSMHMVMKITLPSPKGVVTASVDATSRKDGHFTDH